MKTKIVITLTAIITTSCFSEKLFTSYPDTLVYKETPFLLIRKNLKDFYMGENYDSLVKSHYYPSNNELYNIVNDSKFRNRIGFKLSEYSKRKYGFRVIGFISKNNDTILTINAIKKRRLVNEYSKLKDMYLYRHWCTHCKNNWLREFSEGTFEFSKKDGLWHSELYNYFDRIYFEEN